MSEADELRAKVIRLGARRKAQGGEGQGGEAVEQRDSLPTGWERERDMLQGQLKAHIEHAAASRQREREVESERASERAEWQRLNQELLERVQLLEGMVSGSADGGEGSEEIATRKTPWAARRRVSATDVY